MNKKNMIIIILIVLAILAVFFFYKESKIMGKSDLNNVDKASEFFLNGQYDEAEKIFLSIAENKNDKNS